MWKLTADVNVFAAQFGKISKVVMEKASYRSLSVKLKSTQTRYSLIYINVTGDDIIRHSVCIGTLTKPIETAQNRRQINSNALPLH